MASFFDREDPSPERKHLVGRHVQHEGIFHSGNNFFLGSIPGFPRRVRNAGQPALQLCNFNFRLSANLADFVYGCTNA
jgi:hypothetical protein